MVDESDDHSSFEPRKPQWVRLEERLVLGDCTADLRLRPLTERQRMIFHEILGKIGADYLCSLRENPFQSPLTDPNLQNVYLD